MSRRRKRRHQAGNAGAMAPRNRIGQQFSARTIAMLRSPAFRVLSLAAHRCLARIEIEHARHAGKNNGRLVVTYRDFVEYGVCREAVAPALRELEALGLIQVTERGMAGNAEFRRPNKLRLTYRYTDDAKPTDDWAAIKTVDEAERIARQARAALSEKTDPQYGKPDRPQYGKPDRKFPFPSTENQTKEANSQYGKPDHYLEHRLGRGGRSGAGGGCLPSPNPDCPSSAEQRPADDAVPNPPPSDWVLH